MKKYPMSTGINYNCTSKLKLNYPFVFVRFLYGDWFIQNFVLEGAPTLLFGGAHTNLPKRPYMDPPLGDLVVYMH